MKLSSWFVATAVAISLSSASWQGIKCHLSNFLIRTNVPCPALTFSYLSLPSSPPLSLPPSPFSGSLSLTSVTQVETKQTKLGKLADFVASLFSSHRNVAESIKPVKLVDPFDTVEHSEPLTLSKNSTVPSVTESNPTPFFTTNSKHYSFSEYESCQRNDSDSFSFDSAGLPTCTLNVMSSLDVCLSFSSVFKLRTGSSTTSCYAGICTRKLEEEHLKEFFECHDDALAGFGETLDCKRSGMENSKQSEKNLDINGALTVQNKGVERLHPKTSNGTVEYSCKPSHRLELSTDSDLKKGEAIEKWFKFLVDSILCNQGGTKSSFESVTDFRSLQEDHKTYWEKLTPLQKEQAITMIESYFNKPQSLDLGSTIYTDTVTAFVVAFVATFAAVFAVFVTTIVIVARCALRTPVDDTVVEILPSEYQQPEAFETEESEVVTGYSEVVTEYSEVVTEEPEVDTAKKEPAKASNEEPEELVNTAKEELKQETKEAPNDKSQDASNEKPKEESSEAATVLTYAEKRRIKNLKQNTKKREKIKQLRLQAKKAADEAAKKPQDASSEKPQDASSEKPQVSAIEKPQDVSSGDPQDSSKEKPKEESSEGATVLTYAEKRRVKNLKQNTKKRERIKQLKLQAKKAAEEASKSSDCP